jgi:hypothetical protein
MTLVDVSASQWVRGALGLVDSGPRRVEGGIQQEPAVRRLVLGRAEDQALPVAPVAFRRDRANQIIHEREKWDRHLACLS